MATPEKRYYTPEEYLAFEGSVEGKHDYFDGRIYLERYRGRSAYTFAVQAAEMAVRQKTGLTGVNDVELVRVSRESEDRWLVTLRANGREFAAEAWAEYGEEAVYLTCGSVTPQRPRRFRARLR